jgi:DNA-binding NarL/FixJ family response regulator
VLTSYPSSWEEKAANRAGAVSYLLKDIETDSLIEQLSELA